MNKKLVVLSIDCLHSRDLERGDMPVLRSLMSRGATVARVQSVYPTITYAAHAAIMTGCLPAKTRVISNEVFAPGEKTPEWHWWEKDNRAVPLYRLAREAGWKVGMAHWPVTAGSNVAVNFAEIWPNRPDGDALDAYLAAGSDPAAEAEIFRRHALGYGWRTHPAFDVFAHAAARDMLTEHHVDALFVHSAYLDAAHHQEGNEGDLALLAMKKEDEWLGALIDAVRRNGDEDDTLFAVVSDHGSMDYTRVFHPNALFIGRDLIRLRGGQPENVRAWAHSGGGSCLVYVRDRADRPAVQAILEEAAGNPEYGIDRVMTAGEALGFEPEDASLVVEMKEGWAATGGLAAEALTHCETRATHGYLPDKGPQPVMVFAGPGVARGRVIPEARLIDLCPTLAAWMGVGASADGRVLPIFE